MRSSFLVLVLLAIAFVLSLIVPLSTGCLMAVDPMTIGIVGSSLASGLMGAFGQSAANQQSIDFARDSMAWQERMWHKQNAYNTPSAQMARLRQAGLNPYLVGSDSGLSGASAVPSTPNQPSIGASNPMLGVSQGVSSALSLYNQTKATDANVANQTSQMMKQYADAYSTLANTGMSHSEILRTLKPFTTAFDGSVGSDSIQQGLAADVQLKKLEGDRLSINNRINRIYGLDKAQSVVRQLNLSNDKIGAEIDRILMQNKVSEQDIRESASRIAANFAQAFNLKKQGEYYVCSAAQMGVITDSLRLDLEEKRADFAFNTDVRKWKKDLTHRDQALRLFTGSLDASSMNNEMQSNKFIRYGTAVSGMVGNMFKVNVGLNSSAATFRDLTPKNKPFLYSGDGYRMQGGVLMKDNW